MLVLYEFLSSVHKFVFVQKKIALLKIVSVSFSFLAIFSSIVMNGVKNNKKHSTNAIDPDIESDVQQDDIRS